VKKASVDNVLSVLYHARIMFTKPYLKDWMRRNRQVKLHHLAKAAGVGTWSLWRFLNQKDATITLKTAERVEKAMQLLEENVR